MSSKLSIDANQSFKVELIKSNRLIKVSMFMSIDEFERDMLSNGEFRNNIAFTEIHKCNADNCNKKYALIAGKEELGRYCYECSSAEAGKGYYCEDCYNDNMTEKCQPNRYGEDWFCNKCAK